MLFCDQKQSNELPYMARLCHWCCWSVSYCDMCLHMQARYLCQVYGTDVIGIWTLMCSLSDESVSQSMDPDGHSVVHVNLKCPLGIMRPISNSQVQLQCSWEWCCSKRLRRILTSQHLADAHLWNAFFLQPDVSLNHYQLQDGFVIDLSVRGIGGAGSDTGVVLVN